MNKQENVEYLNCQKFNHIILPVNFYKYINLIFIQTVTVRKYFPKAERQYYDFMTIVVIKYK